MPVADPKGSNPSAGAAKAADSAKVIAPGAGTSTKPAGAGLEGVVAAKSEVCFIDGQAGRLVYRGYEIEDPVENATFEEVAFLLWDGKLPNRQELNELRRELSASA